MRHTKRGLRRRGMEPGPTTLENANTCTLREELRRRGLEHEIGPRSDMVSVLRAQGVVYVDTRNVPCTPCPSRATDESCLFLGHMAGRSETRPHRLAIANRDTPEPLIGGDFEHEHVTITRCLSLREDETLSASTPGQEGDMRRSKGNLFLYRRTGVPEGWYRVSFDYRLEP